MKKMMMKNQGFTLVELMVVVAIIGILSAVAIPNFKKYQAKSKTSEAKIQLAALYTAQQGFYTDYNNYGSCLNLMGFDPSQEKNNRYYAIGFNAGSAAANLLITQNNGPAACAGAGTAWAAGLPTAAVVPVIPTNNLFVFGASKRIGTNTALEVVPAAYTVAANGQTYIAGANGIISADQITAATADQWSITQAKIITQPVVGY